MTQSAVYEGRVYHVRAEPRRHSFRYRMSMLYLDLEELPTLFERRWFWSAKRWNLAWFRRADYLGPSDRPLREAVLDRVEHELSRRPVGPVRMLTMIRTFGYVFNPVTFYFCFDTNDQVEAIVAEITNTPWRERHSYVLDARQAGSGDMLRWRFDKEFHISPFFDMEQEYEWCFSRPGETLDVEMTNFEAGRVVFRAGLSCTRRPMTSAALARSLVLFPLMPIKVHAAIYWQAARLFLKRTPFLTHPDKRTAPDASTS